MRPIDPIVVREEQARRARKTQVLASANTAGEALLWFHTYALGSDKRTPAAKDVLAANLRLVASSTVGVDAAVSYVRRAVAEFHSAILERAIEMAQEEFEVVDPCRKCGRLVRKPCRDAESFSRYGPWDSTCREYFT